MINTTIGKYKITKLIGEGGMASVYEAEHEMLGTKVAIKVLNPILSANYQIRERFINEAKLMASLDHPNITKVIDFDERTNQLSITMEYLNGEDLNQKIKRSGPLSEKEITNIFSQTLSAFQYAHEKGIVHRDIKPSNIFILPNGHVKILDFGIAKLFGQGNEMTQTGTQMGTPIYMSPEQVKADKSIDHRSDIYSLGVTMYYAINGKPPYNSETDSQFDIFNKIVFEPLAETDKTSFLNDFVKKACEKERNLRYQSCQEWINEFNSIHLAKYDNNLNSLDAQEQLTKENTKANSNNLFDNDSNEESLRYLKDRPLKDWKNHKIIALISAIFIAGILATFLFLFKKSDSNSSDYVKNNISKRSISENLIKDKFTKPSKEEVLINSKEKYLKAEDKKSENKKSENTLKNVSGKTVLVDEMINKSKEKNHSFYYENEPKEKIWIHSKGTFKRTLDRNNYGEIIWIEDNGRFIYYETSYNSTTHSYSVYRKDELHVKVEIFNTYIYYRDKNNPNGFIVYYGNWR
jgi:serine/threonine protein kinase